MLTAMIWDAGNRTISCVASAVDEETGGFLDIVGSFAGEWSAA
jgi:hypothetical protein